ncbi:hypothetical protein AX16_006705 [Volvariella volvacea WC 439]|nr:hypothetical protein AX16_006705 [Volvariella volvacea WC 439]
MNSSLDGDSPTSTPSSPSPPPEEINFHQTQPVATQLLERLMGAVPGTSGGKRRLPGGLAAGGHGGPRDAKSRRRGEPAARNPHSQGSGNYDYPPAGEGGRRGTRDDLVDVALVEYLRREIGDPFQEGLIKALNREE